MIYSELTYQEIIDFLIEHKYRNSNARNFLIKCFFEKSHWSIEELHQKGCKDFNKYLTIQTVYNTIQILIKHNFLVSYNLDGKTRIYELFNPIAFHCYCTNTKRVVHIDYTDALKKMLFDAVKAKNIDCLHIQIKAIGKKESKK